jgi:hypothetical protein
MAPRFSSQRKGEYVYDVTVTKDETEGLPRRYRARLSNVQRLEGGRLMYVQVNLPDTYGPTVTEAMSALDASFDTWRRQHLPNHQ